ncbi:MAG: TraR/DksA family transcriptional regulator [Planctomycetota bacterium]|jgi:RNA polymerase-binding transcription factor DksA
MAKKKVTKKKTRAAASRKVAKKTTAKKPAKKPAKKTTKKRVAKTVAKKTTKKTTKKKVAKTVAKKTTATASRGEKKAAKVKAPAKTTAKTAKAAAKTTRKKTTVGKGTTAAQKAAAAKAARSSPDSNGYVIINGRRVRMMKPRSRVKAAAEPAPEAANQKPIKTKLKKKDLDHYRGLLLERRRELVGDLNAMEKQALQATGSNVSHMPIHMADIGTDTYDQDFMLGLAENERQRLREIDAALVRIEDRTYGICQMTGKVIPKTRLNAKPWARYTIEAARQIESGVGE